MWNMFIDDERYPADDGLSWVVVRTVEEAIEEVIERKSIPDFISFDHDLGQDQATGFDFVKWIVDCVVNERYALPPKFDYYIHSQNPIGKENIDGLLRCLMKYYS